MPSCRKPCSWRTCSTCSKPRRSSRSSARKTSARGPSGKPATATSPRGRAHAITKAGPAAEAGLTRALEWTSDPRLRDTIRHTLGNNRETNLKDDSAALAAYREVIAPAKQLGSAEQFSAVQGIARILTKHGQFDEALATLRKVDLEKQGGFWRGSLLLSLADAAADPRLRKLAEEKLATKELNHP